MESEPIEDPGLNQAVDELFAAFDKYRTYIKRHHRGRLAGVMWIRRATDMLIYSESERYSNQICELTYDLTGDSFSITERDDTEEDDL